MITLPHRSRACRRWLFISVMTCMTLRPGYGVDKVAPARIVYKSEEGYYIDTGENAGLANGDIGVVRKQGVDVAVVRVVQAGRKSSFIEIITTLQQTSLRPGDPIFFESRVRTPDPNDEKGKALDRAVLDNETENVTPSTSTLKTGAPQEEFIPLLALPMKKRVAAAREKNIFHGRLRARQIYQTISNEHTDDWASRLDSDGSFDRIGGSLWSFLWSGNLTYRSGDSFVNATDYHDPELHLYRMSLNRKNRDGGFISLGRILPIQLPGLGYLDGAHIEKVLSPRWRWGVLSGARPDRQNLSLSSREWAGSVYTSLEQGDPTRLSYHSTWGLLQTLFLGQADELGLLWDQRATLGPKLNAISTTQLDVDIGQSAGRRTFRVPRADLYVQAPVKPFLSFRSGFSHFERPDTASERDLSNGDTTSILNSSYWRFWIGSNQNLPWSLQLDEELGFTRTQEIYSQGMWRLSLSRSGLWIIPQGSLTVAMYNLDKFEGDGYGFLASAIAPLFTNRLDLTTNAGFRYKSVAGSGKTLSTNDYSVHLDWHITRAWDMTAGVSRVFQDNITSTIADFSLSYRW